MLNLPAPYPLTWPEGRRRTPPGRRVRATYTVRGYAEAMSSLETEIARWQRRERTTRITDWQLTATHSGRGRPDTSGDPGASLWFVLGGQDISAAAELRVLACDRFVELPHNIRGLGLTMERLRLVDEVGAYSIVQATEGARLLPAPERAIDWRQVLGLVAGDWPIRVVEDLYRSQAREAGEGSARLTELNLAIAAARKELKPQGPIE